MAGCLDIDEDIAKIEGELAETADIFGADGDVAPLPFSPELGGKSGNEVAVGVVVDDVVA